MNDYFSKTVNGNFETIEAQVRTLLKHEGFGILTEIDMQTTLKEKLNEDFRKYKILGACHPPYAFKALQAENKIGTMLPCNVILQEHSKNKIEVSTINPMMPILASENTALKTIAQEVSSKLENVINQLKNEK